GAFCFSWNWPGRPSPPDCPVVEWPTSATLPAWGRSGSNMASKVNALLTAGVGVTALALGLAVGVGAPRMLPELFGTSEQVRNEQIVRSIERLDQVVLVSLGIQGIAEQSANSEIFGVAVPGSTRTMFLQYSFNAKLGLNGEDVVIE